MDVHPQLKVTTEETQQHHGNLHPLETHRFWFSVYSSLSSPNTGEVRDHCKRG